MLPEDKIVSALVSRSRGLVQNSLGLVLVLCDAPRLVRVSRRAPAPANSRGRSYRILGRSNSRGVSGCLRDCQESRLSHILDSLTLVPLLRCPLCVSLPRLHLYDARPPRARRLFFWDAHLRSRTLFGHLRHPFQLRRTRVHGSGTYLADLELMRTHAPVPCTFHASVLVLARLLPFPFARDRVPCLRPAALDSESVPEGRCESKPAMLTGSRHVLSKLSLLHLGVPRARFLVSPARGPP